jgi:hypothetical protein
MLAPSSANQNGGSIAALRFLIGSVFLEAAGRTNEIWSGFLNILLMQSGESKSELVFNIGRRPILDVLAGSWSIIEGYQYGKN